MTSLGWMCILAALLPGGIEAAPTPDLRIGLPGTHWSLWIHPADFEFGPPTPGPTEDTVWAAGDAIEPGFSMTVLLRARTGARGAADCLALMSARAGVGSCGDRGIDCSEHAGMATFEYRVKRDTAHPFDQRHLHAYVHHEGACGEIHLTKTDYRARDRRMFLAVLDSVERIDARAEPSGP